MAADDSSVRKPSARCAVCGAKNQAPTAAAASGEIFRCRICGSPLRIPKKSAPTPPPTPLQPPQPRPVRAPRPAETASVTPAVTRRPPPTPVQLVPPLPPLPPPPDITALTAAPAPLKAARQKAIPPWSDEDPDPIDRYRLFAPEAEQQRVTAVTPPQRPPLARGRGRLAIVALIVATAVAAATWWTQRDEGKPQQDPFANPSSADPTAKWETFADPENRFIVDMPGRPSVEQIGLPSAIGELNTELFTSEVGSDVAVIGVVRPPDTSAIDLHAIAAAFATSSDLDIAAEVPSVDGIGRPQIDVRLTGTGPNYLARILDAGNRRVFVVMARSSSGLPEATFNRLIASFKPT